MCTHISINNNRLSVWCVWYETNMVNANWSTLCERIKYKHIWNSIYAMGRTMVHGRKSTECAEILKTIYTWKPIYCTKYDPSIWTLLVNGHFFSKTEMNGFARLCKLKSIGCPKSIEQISYCGVEKSLSNAKIDYFLNSLNELYGMNNTSGSFWTIWLLIQLKDFILV